MTSRSQLPDSAFCGPDRSFPITSQADVDAAAHLLGKADNPAAVRACIVRKARAAGWRLPAAWLAAHTAALADAGTEAEGIVVRIGKIFAVGAYPDKDFSLSEAEADAAIADFAPVPADYEHTPGPLDGKLGTLTRVWRDGADLWGEATVPAWLDPLLADSGRKLSLAWDRATKQIAGWGWVRSPRISDAALYAAFAGARHSTADLADMQQLHDIAVRQGATCAPAAMHKEAHMSFIDRVRAWLEAGAPAEFTEGDPPAPTVPATGATSQAHSAQRAPVLAELTATLTPAPDPRIAALEQQLAAQQAAFAQQLAKSRAAEAATFADGLVSAGRLPPYLRPWAAALYAQALADDAAGAVQVTFTDAAGGTQTGDRAATLRALLGGLPVVQFAGTGTFTPAPGQTLLAVPGVTPPPQDADPNAPLTDAQRAALLGMTDLGRAVLADRKNGTGGH